MSIRDVRHRIISIQCWFEPHHISDVRRSQNRLHLMRVVKPPAPTRAKVAELADAPDLGSGGETHGGSSPPFRTTHLQVPPLRPLVLVAPGLRPAHQVQFVYPARPPGFPATLLCRFAVHQNDNFSAS